MQNTNPLTVENLSDIVQDAQLNFLFGAGTSAILLNPLGDIENWLTELAANKYADPQAVDVVRAAVFAYFFTGVIAPNKEILAETKTEKVKELQDSYIIFLQTINKILLQRRSSILNKEVNIFTTNIDIAIEVAAEKIQLELNDGFSGRYRPKFSTSNFGNVKSRRSLQYDNLSEIPTFNLLKLHGSLSWKVAPLAENAKQPIINFEHTTKLIDTIQQKYTQAQDLFCELNKESSMNKALKDLSITDKLNTLSEKHFSLIKSFMEEYEKLAIVNPNKDKFRVTVLNQNYYDLLRIFSNSLEKENSVLFVIGFSCRDEHIRSLILRAAQTNPTLQVIVFAYDPNEVASLKKELEYAQQTNNNIRIVCPPKAADPAEQKKYSLRKITKDFFAPLLNKPLNTSAQNNISSAVEVAENV